MTAAAPTEQTFRCPNCGAPATYDWEAQALGCGHCQHQSPIEEAHRQVLEHDLRAALASAPATTAAEMTPGGKEVECTNCGARAVVRELSKRCAFCDAPMVMEVAHPERMIAPESLLPAAIGKDRALRAFSEWLASRWFAPNDLVRRAALEEIDAVYLPYWSFDSDTTTAYRGQRGDHYMETETYRDAQGKTATRQVQKTRWTPRRGTVRVYCDDVLVCASKGVPQRLIDTLEPWDLGRLVPFDGRFLAGAQAERYALELAPAFAAAEKKMEGPIRRAISADIGGDTQKIDWLSIAHADEKYRHLLLPVWMANFRYGDRVFRILVNATTGELQGERPYSVLKIAAFVVGILTALGTALALLESR